MKKSKSIQLQVMMAIVMFAISIFMTIRYHSMVEDGTADKINVIAYYFWIFSIVAWLIKIIHDVRITYQLRKNQ